jgi:hypothetical protein
MRNVWLLRLITFLASFLLFQIEFIIGKIFLAQFGGGFMVWGACLVFFQGMLLLGYLYAHKIIEKFTIKKYLLLHCVLLVSPFFFFPGRPLALVYSAFGLSMVVDVFIHLTLTIGLVFFVLSTMSIISQSWLSASSLAQRKNPYALFAVSNLGSLLALISYPFVFEMVFDLHQQQNIWRILYAVMVLLYMIGLKFIPVDSFEQDRDVQEISVESTLIWQWFLYGAAGVTVFLAVTNVLTAEIAPMPLLWMLPLVIYLLSYVLNFQARPWFPAWIERYINFSVGLGVVLYFLMVRQIVPALVSMALMLIFVFILCMFCQRRLYVLRPCPEKLTFFYFIISLGGFLGGVVVTWAVPLIYVNHAEYFLGLVFLFMAWVLEGHQRKTRFFSFVLIVLVVAAIYWGPFFLMRHALWGLGGLMFFIVLSFHFFRKEKTPALAVLILILILLDVMDPRWFRQKYIHGNRNYYGIMKVVEKYGLRTLIHGTTIHGAQFLDPEKRFIPLTYYHPKSPPAQLLIHESHYKNIGIVGLGTGALAMYGRAYQTIDFYELDPDVLSVAKKYFSFLSMSAADIKYIISDARVGLQENDTRRYEILIVDAFSGDAVPIHLLTRECLEVYRSRTTEDGVTLFHLANRYINLPLAFIRTAASTEAYIIYKKDKDSASDWVGVTYDKGVYDRLVHEYDWVAVNKPAYKGFRAWTDQYSTITPYFFQVEILKTLLQKWDIE